MRNAPGRAFGTPPRFPDPGGGYRRLVAPRKPRPIWSGSISFGLVNVPARMYPAIDEQGLSFHLVHEKDSSPIGYQKICKAEGKSVPDDEIVKAYELSDGKYVEMADEDFEAAEESGYHTLTLLDFVPYEQIDPIFFERTYYLGPDEGAERAYVLLVKALEESGLAAVARYVFRNRQQLGCVRVRDGVLTLEKMYLADEIRPTKGIAPTGVKVEKQELKMARALIDRLAGDFDPGKYEDVYRKKLLAVIRAKGRGKEIQAVPSDKSEPPADLMDALRQSLEESGRRHSGAHSRPHSRRPRRRSTARKH